MTFHCAPPYGSIQRVTHPYNEGCVVDLAEEQMGDGGGDLCLENKVYLDLVPVGASPATDTTLRGATHGVVWQHGGAPNPHELRRRGA
eukprot:812073-Prymnesium_polylepis.1